MEARYVRYNAGNLAIQQEVWTIPMSAAKAVLKVLEERSEVGPGTYWESNFLKPYRRAIRAKAETVKIYTAGFSSAAFAGYLISVGAAIRFDGDR